MAISIDNLEVIIDVVDQFSDELQSLASQLAEIGTLAESVDNITIDVDVRGDEAAMAKLNALAANAQVADGGVNLPNGARTDGGRIDVPEPFPSFEAMERVMEDTDPLPMDRVFAERFGTDADLPNRFVARQLANRPDFGAPLHGGRRGGIIGRLRSFIGEATEGEGTFGSLNLRMETFHNLLASMLPMLFVLIGALPVAATALITLAGAALAAAGMLAGIGALGLVGLASQRGDGDIMSGLQDIFEELRESFLDSFMPVARAFDDLATDALDGLEQLFDEIAARADTLVQLKDEARALGQFLLDVIPVAIERLAQLTEAFAPVLAAIGEWLASSNILERWVDITARALPHLWGIANALGAILPALMDVSMGFLRAAEMIFQFFAVISTLLGVIPGLREGLGAVVGALLFLVSVTAFVIKTFSALSVLWGIGAVKSLVAFITGLEALTIAELQAMTATQLLTMALRTLLATTGIGLVLVAVGELTNQFLSAGGAIDDATSSLKEFGRVSNRVNGASIDSPAAARRGVSRRGQTTVNVTNETTIEGAENTDEASRALSRQRFKDSEFSAY